MIIDEIVAAAAGSCCTLLIIFNIYAHPKQARQSTQLAKQQLPTRCTQQCNVVRRVVSHSPPTTVKQDRVPQLPLS